jgi:5-bromo-4-chloroindolyl phosphate hydrolysis protein
MSDIDPLAKSKQPDKVAGSRPLFDKRQRADLTFAWRYLALLGAGFPALYVFELAGPFGALSAFLVLFYGLAFEVPKQIERWIERREAARARENQPIDARQQVFQDAYGQVGVLARARKKLPDDVRENVTRLHASAKAIVDSTFKSPHRLAPILRFFTYYLPATADLVRDRLKLADRAGSQRLTEIDAMLGRLVDAFDAFETAALAPEMASVDMDVELLGKALSVDLDEMMTR